MSRLPILIALLLPALAAAQTPIDETRPVEAGARIEIENMKGRIVVRGWDRREVHVGGELGEGVEKLQIEGGGKRLSIRVQYPQKSGWFGFGGEGAGGPSRIEVSLPRDAEVAIESVSADVEVSELAGGTLRVESVSGDVDASAIDVRSADIETVSGDQTLRVDSADVSAESVSGDIEMRGRLDGQVRSETVSGGITIEAAAASSVQLSTVSGDVDFRGALADGGRLRAEAVSGDLDLRLPKATSARIAAKSFSGSIRSDAGKVEKAEYGPGSSLSTRIGGGDGELRAETFSGDVRISLD